MFNFEEELAKLPASPGVYLMHDEHDEIIYVGKAISLRNRVRSYFRSSTKHTAKISKMVSLVHHFEYIVTDSELEALILECNLIKEHRPKYNTMLKDDKSYPFIKVTINEAYPRILFSRDMKRDKSRYFGPYTSIPAVRDTIELLSKIYKIRTCKKALPQDIGKGRTCLNYHINQCAGPCMAHISQEEYMENVKAVITFLEGNYKPVLKLLEGQMNEAAEKMDFEAAAGYRDLLFSVREIAQKQKMTNEDTENRDVIACDTDLNDAVVQVFFIRNGKLLGREHFYMQIDVEEKKSTILSEFIKQYYGGTPYIPRELMLQCEIEDAEVIENWLTAKNGNRVRIVVPKRGEKEKLVELAAKNAKMVLEKDREKIKLEQQRTVGAVNAIANLLGLSKLNRMEAFDISNTSGYQSVGSMVVYENGKPKKSDYRKFKIKTVSGPDDYASMEEVLTRRLEHFDDVYPDLIMMDGGRGQVNVALGVIEKLGLNIAVCGMVKDDHHRTRGLYYNNEEIPISPSSEEFKLITRIQDEAHRFAIEYHRSLRGKNQVHSILDDIQGIGPKRRRMIMKKFASLEEVKNATLEELLEVEGMNVAAAQSVYDFFRRTK